MEKNYKITKEKIKDRSSLPLEQQRQLIAELLYNSDLNYEAEFHINDLEGHRTKRTPIRDLDIKEIDLIFGEIINRLNKLERADLEGVYEICGVDYKLDYLESIGVKPHFDGLFTIGSGGPFTAITGVRGAKDYIDQFDTMMKEIIKNDSPKVREKKKETYNKLTEESLGDFLKDLFNVNEKDFE